MMDERDTRDFNVSFDRKEHAAEHSQEILESKVDSLGWKVMLLSVIVPCLIVIIAGVAYFGLREKMIDFQDIGATEVQKLSNLLESRLTVLTAQQKELEEEILPKVKQSRTDISNIQYNLNNAKKSRDGLKQSVAALDKKITALETQIKAMTLTTAEVKKQAAALSGKIGDIQTAMTRLDQEKATRAELERVFAAYETKMLAKLDATTAQLKKQISALKTSIPATPSPATPPPTTTGIVEQPLSQ